MTEDVAQIEADGSDSDTCHSERGEEIGPAKWGQTGSQTCSTLVSVFKSPCAATLLLRSNQEGEGEEKIVLGSLWKMGRWTLLPSSCFMSLGPGSAHRMN